MSRAVLLDDAPPAARVPRKCRWCKATFEPTPQGAARMWRHARKEHRQQLETCGWPVSAETKAANNGR